MPKEAEAMDTPKTAEFAHIGTSVIIKGELSGSEDLYVDGQVEGTIELHSNSLIIGPNGQVRADVNAKGVIVQGKMEGNIRATERTELKKSAIAVGNILTQRIAIEDGAYFKGKVDIQKDGAKPDLAKPDLAKGEARSAQGAAASAGGTSGAAVKTPVTETK
jgi:cytoskeletal protein CcmA (bactofilin family)